MARSFRPFRTATLRGLAIILPPLLTIIFFIWAWNVIETYLLLPVESAINTTIVYSIENTISEEAVRTGINDGELRLSGKVLAQFDGTPMLQIASGDWLPKEVVEVAQANSFDGQLKNANQYYRQYVQARYLKRHLFIPAFLSLFLAILYLLGKLLAAGIGRIILRYVETLITQLPIIRNVYSSVKQVTDFALNENEMSFNSIVAVEYPRKGIWSMGFVTGEGLKDVRNAAGEPILTVLMPTSPMPATGFTISVPKSQTIDLNISIDQAVQFCVSCGVVIPDHQQNQNTIEATVESRFLQMAGPTTTDATQENDPKMS
ncbi:MAG: DUF502 domain-containing protein [Planctomycetota bacterium]